MFQSIFYILTLNIYISKKEEQIKNRLYGKYRKEKAQNEEKKLDG